MRDGVTVQAERPPSPAFPTIMTQTLLFLSPSSSWQPRPCSQNLWRCSPKCSVTPGSVHLKVSPRGRKSHGDGTDLSSRHSHFPSPQGCLCGISIAMELGKLHSGVRAVKDTSLFSLPCSAPYMNTFLLFFFLSLYFFFLYFFFSLFPITPLMQSRAADYKRGSLTWAIGLLH